MGERGSICVRREGSHDIFFYTHWYGDQTHDAVCRALARRDRWDDSVYLRRIIFCELLKLGGKERALEESTGFGISAVEVDGDNPTVYVNVSRQVVIYDGIEMSFNKCAQRGQVMKGGAADG